jgi:membrane protease subunit HflK
MPRLLKVLLVLLALWLLTGIYIVGGNERAVVRRFGQAVAEADGRLRLKGNGLQFDWPWPISQVDRINLAEVKTLTVPLESETADPSRLLADDDSIDPPYLTGDKNLLNVQLTVHYRIAEAGVRDFLFRSVFFEDRLSCLVENATADLVAQCGVDFVQVSGLSELRRELARTVQQQADRQKLGIVIEDVILDEVSPPVPVKADFLDVANARADREQSIQSALSDAEQERHSARALARQIRDDASGQAQRTVQSAKGKAARFLEIIASFQDPESPGRAPKALARRLVLEQQYYQALSEILEKIQGQVFLDTGQPVDLTIWRSLPKETSESQPSTEESMPTPSGSGQRD